MKEKKFLPAVYAQGHGDKVQYVADNVTIMGMVPPKYFNVFRVSVTFAMGDGDDYETQEVFFADQEKMMPFLDFLLACAAEYPNGKSGSKHYKNVEGYDEYVNENPWECGPNPLTWPVHPDMDDIYACFEAFEVVYFGATGQKHSVELTLSEA